MVACLIGSWKSMNMMVIFLFFFVNLWVQFWKSWISTGPRVQVCFELFIFLLAEHSRQRWLIKRTFFFFFNILPNYNIRESNHVNFHDEHFEPSLSIHGFIVCVVFFNIQLFIKVEYIEIHTYDRRCRHTCAHMHAHQAERLSTSSLALTLCLPFCMFALCEILI